MNAAEEPELTSSEQEEGNPPSTTFQLLSQKTNKQQTSDINIHEGENTELD